MPNISLNWTFAPRFSPLSSKVFTSLSYLSVVLSVADTIVMGGKHGTN